MSHSKMQPETTEIISDWSSWQNIRESLRMITKNGRFRINKDQAARLLALVDEHCHD